MSTSSFPLNPAGAVKMTRFGDRPPSVPWYIWFGALAVTSAAIGGAWDVPVWISLSRPLLNLRPDEARSNHRDRNV